jgi:hypothetical protein
LPEESAEAKPRTSKASIFPFNVKILGKSERVDPEIARKEVQLTQLQKENEDLKMNLRLNKESL